MKFLPLIKYINFRDGEEYIKEKQKTYDSDILNGILILLSKQVNGKAIKLDNWSTIIQKVNGELVEDNRNSKQIINDTLNLFKK